MNFQTPNGNQIRLSFWDGSRVEISGPKDAEYHVEFRDAAASDLVVSGISISKRDVMHWCSPTIWNGAVPAYFIKWHVTVTEDGKQVLDYVLDLQGKDVYIQINSSALGDTIAWTPYAEEFRKKHQCNVHVATFHNELFAGEYPYLDFCKPGSGHSEKFDFGYIIGSFDDQYARNKNNWRTIPLQQIASDYLGLDYREVKPRIRRSDLPRPIPEKYVAIAEFSTFDCKLWLNPDGWNKTVEHLTSLGLKVVSVSTERTQLKNVVSANARPIEETIRNIQHAEFFIGVSSGCAWLAWALGVPTVVISGSTDTFTEMTDCYRVINKMVCHGCINDKEVPFDRGNRRLCPRNKNFECSTSITFKMVKAAIDRLMKDHMTYVFPPEKEQKQSDGVLMILPHCSTGGLPQYAYQCVRDLRNAGVPVTVIEWNDYGNYDVQKKRLKAIAPFYTMSGDKLKQLHQIVADVNPSVIHLQEFAEYFLPEKVAGYLYLKPRSCQIVETSHGTEVVAPKDKKYLPDRFIFASQYHMDKYAVLGVPSSVAEYRTEQQVRPNRTEALSKLGLISDRKHVLNVGLFTPGKNQGELFEIARKLPDILFHFVGNQAPNFADYWKPLMESKPENCMIWGERHDVELFYASMDLFYFASTNEFNPIVIKEALAWQMPILMRDLATYGGKYHRNPLVEFISVTDNVRSLAENLRRRFRTLGSDLLDAYKFGEHGSTPKPPAGAASIPASEQARASRETTAARLPILVAQERSHQPETAQEQAIPGWFDPANRRQLDALIKKHDIRTVIEVGSFLGLSAVWFARNPQIERVTCIDTWDTAGAEKNDPELFAEMTRLGFYGDFLPMFVSNMKAAGVWDKIEVVLGLSGDVASMVDQADLVYIDADHSRAGCLADIKAYLPKARRIICGDDYVARPEFGVIEAVSKALPKHKHCGGYPGNGPFWWDFVSSYSPDYSEVAVIIPNLNYGKTLKRAIMSAQSQTVPPLEIIVVDGGSKDDSARICKELGVEFIVERKGKMARAKNTGVENSLAEFIVPLDADDWIEPTYIERCLERMTDGVGVVATQLQWPDGGIQVPDPPFTVERLLERNRLFSCSMIRRAAFEAIEGYDEHPALFEDWDMWLRMVAAGWQIGVVDEPLFHFTSRNCGEFDERMSREQEREYADYMRTKHEESQSRLLVKD
jgi:autotransporter strand-loop-strand O-heptosyltransferase